MLNNREIVLETLKHYGADKAAAIQTSVGEMTGTELYENEVFIPDFTAACALKNMLDRPAGFTCRSTSGRIVALIQPYDSTIYTQEPEELPAQWRFKWSKDPAKALPFVAISTSPYDTGDCCTDNGSTYRSKIDSNVHSPSDYPQGWEEVSA